MGEALLEHEVPVDGRHDVLFEVEGGGTLPSLVDGQRLHRPAVVVELGQDALGVAGDQRARRVPVVAGLQL